MLISLLAIDAAYAYEFPPYQGVTLKFIGNVSGDYSNNVTFTSDKENRIEDFRTMLNLGLDAQYRGKKRAYGISGRVTRQILERSDNVKNPSENLLLSYSSEITKYDSMRVRNYFTHTQEPGKQVGGIDMDACIEYYEDYGYSRTDSETICNEFNDQFGRVTGRFDSYTNNLNFDYTREIGDSLTVSPSFVYSKNWSTDEAANDSDSNQFGMRLNYKYSEATSFNVTYNNKVSEYEVGEKLSRETINAGITHNLTKRFSVNGVFGKDIVSNGNDSVSVNTSLMSQIDKRTSASLTYIQGTELSANANTTFENWQVSGRLSRMLEEHLKATVSAFYGKGDYSPTDITDIFIGASVNISYVFWQGKRGSSMSGTLGYSYSDLESTDEARDYARNSARFGFLLAI